jgi:hypothetical protein
VARQSKLWELMSPEQKKQEYEWAVQLYETRAWFIEHVRHALTYRNIPAGRKAIYTDWRQKYGDDRARSLAKYAEACIAGRASLMDIIKMNEKGPPDAKDYV